jgi:hypothetical protein
MFRIVQDAGRVRIATVCDHCGGEIDNARLAIAVRSNDRGDMATLHKGRCDRAFQAAHPESAAGHFDLDRAVAFVAGGLNMTMADLERADQTSRELARAF